MYIIIIIVIIIIIIIINDLGISCTVLRMFYVEVFRAYYAQYLAHVCLLFLKQQKQVLNYSRLQKNLKQTHKQTRRRGGGGLIGMAVKKSLEIVIEQVRIYILCHGNN